MSEAINLKDIWKKYNIWLSVGGFVVLIIAAWVFVLVPIRRNIENNADEMQKKMIDRDIYAERVAKIPDMEKTRAVFAQNESNLRVFLNKNNEVDFIKKIETIAEDTGNKADLQIIDDAGTQKPKAAAGKKGGSEIEKALPKIPYLSMTINLEGNYEQLANFLHKVENLDYYVDVLAISMNKSEIEAPVDPFAAEKNKPGLITSATEVIKSSLSVVVYLEK
ncbi:MAG: hypothetical protein WC238_02015 [Parcubacteria group bacterium]|jgi:Tfp pilus assembly protein PilO